VILVGWRYPQRPRWHAPTTHRGPVALTIADPVAQRLQVTDALLAPEQVTPLPATAHDMV
jgi:hypothetical protein